MRGKYLAVRDVATYVHEYDRLLNPTGGNRWSPPLSALHVDSDEVVGLTDLTRSYHRALEYVAANYSVFKGLLGYDEELDGLLAALPSYHTNVPLARLDVFKTAAGLKAIEANTESPGGSEECDAIERLYSRFFPSRGVTRGRVDGVLDTLLSSYEEQALHKGFSVTENPRIVVLEWPDDVRYNGVRYDLFLDHARMRGMSAELASPEEVVFQGDRGMVRGRPVDIFYRRFLIHDLPGRHPEGFDLVKRLENSPSAIVNPGRSKCVGSKQVSALISDPVYGELFPPFLQEDVRYLRQAIPRTYSLLRPELLPFSVSAAASLKDEFVLKAGNGASSKNVWVGEDTSRSEWDGLMKGSWGGNFVLQDRLPLRRRRVELHAGGPVSAEMFYLMSPFSFNGSYGGLYARATENNLLTSSAGGRATILPVYER